MAGRYPKPGDQRVSHHEGLSWTVLPAAREGDPPDLPQWRLWHAETLTWWAALWRKPQALMWESSGSTLWALACLYDDLIAGRADAAKVSSEVRQHEDRHGLSPKALLQLRWRLVGPEGAEPAKRSRKSSRSSAERRKQLRVVP